MTSYILQTLHFPNTGGKKITRIIFEGKQPQNLTQTLTPSKNTMTNRKQLMTTTILWLKTRTSQ